MPMKNPPYPGRSIKDACLEPLGLNVTEGAKVLGVTRNTLSRVINGQSGISPDMAIRLEKAGWSNADHWLRLQTAYDLAQARKHQEPHPGGSLRAAAGGVGAARVTQRRMRSETPRTYSEAGRVARGHHRPGCSQLSMKST